MPLSGDFGELERIARVLSDATPVLARAGHRAAEAIQTRLGHQYDAGVDPSDNPWRPVTEQTLLRRKKKKTPPPLTDTGMMRAHSRAISGVSGITVSIDRPGRNADVPSILQKDRNIVPPSSTLPGPWRRVVEDSIRKSISEDLGEV